MPAKRVATWSSSSGSGKKGFLDRLTKAFHAEPRDRDELKELLNVCLKFINFSRVGIQAVAGFSAEPTQALHTILHDRLRSALTGRAAASNGRDG